MTAPEVGALDPTGDLARAPAVVAARRLAAELLVPQAQQVDDPRGSGVPRSHVDALAARGLMGVTAPRDVGGLGDAAAVDREVVETLAGACGSTWFVATQHRTPLAVALDAPAPLRARWARPLATGQALGGIALAHVRRPGTPPVAAEREPGGWRLSGAVGWCTSWGLADVLCLAAQTPEEDLLLCLVEAHDQPGLVAGEPWRLAAVQGTATVTLSLDGLRVDDGDVAAVVPRARFLAADAAKVANATPAVFGLVRTAVAALRETAERRRLAPAAALADAVEAEAVALRARVYALVDDVPAPERLEERRALRARAGELAVRATSGLVAARAGGALALSDPAQRLAREALFHLVQAQTPEVRAAQLDRWAQGVAADAPAAEVDRGPTPGEPPDVDLRDDLARRGAA